MPEQRTYRPEGPNFKLMNHDDAVRIAKRFDLRKPTYDEEVLHSPLGAVAKEALKRAVDGGKIPDIDKGEGLRNYVRELHERGIIFV